MTRLLIAICIETDNLDDAVAVQAAHYQAMRAIGKVYDKRYRYKAMVATEERQAIDAVGEAVS